VALIMTNNRLAAAIFMLALHGSLVTGCVTMDVPYRANPFLQQKARQIRTVTLLPTEVKVYQIDAGGVREEIEEWSSQARDNIIAAFESELPIKTDMIVNVVREENPGLDKALLADCRALFHTVVATILLHTYNPRNQPYIFQEKLENFDYSLGSDLTRLATEGDALLLVSATDHIWTAGRRTLQAAGIVVGIGAGAATGRVAIPRLGGSTIVNAALVDRDNGDILWFNHATFAIGDLRESRNATRMIRELFKELPVSLGIKPPPTSDDNKRNQE
jgi:hypothetical protein